LSFTSRKILITSRKIVFFSVTEVFKCKELGLLAKRKTNQLHGKTNQLEQFKKGESAGAKENRYGRVPRLSCKVLGAFE